MVLDLLNELFKYLLGEISPDKDKATVKKYVVGTVVSGSLLFAFFLFVFVETR